MKSIKDILKEKKLITCKKCGGKDAYIQKIENISWCICPACQYEERTKHYFNK